MKNNLRYEAFKIVYEVKFNQGYSNLLLQANLDDFEEQDKALITKIVYGSLQNFDLLQYQLKNVSYQKITNKQLVLIIISLYQKHFLTRIPDYAIVNEAIKIAKAKFSYQDSRFINALLNRLIENELEYANESDEDQNLAINYSHPLWLIKMLKKQYGSEILLAYLKENQEDSKIHVRYNRLSLQKELLLNNDNFIANADIENAYLFTGNDIAHNELYLNGIISIQDFSSQQVGLFSGVKPNMRVLDMCAAPGTKTMQMAELMNNQGEIKAYDIHQHKIPLIEKQAKRLNISIVEANMYDATKLNEVEKSESFDMILCDALCTGLGVIQRKPEIKYQDISVSMDYIIKVQAQLLISAYTLLKKGGTLIYSTCTINKKENEHQVQVFLKQYDDLELVEQKMIFNFETKSDCFYMAKIVKK